MQPLYFKPRLAPFLLSEASGQRSRDNIVVTQTDTEVLSGTLLTKIDTGAGTFAMVAGATGNPTASAITVGAAALPGVYNLNFTAATKFTVEDPNGLMIGNGTVGVAFSKAGLGFTLTAGGTAAVVGDAATITVAVGSGKYKPYTAAGAAGPADAVLYEYLPAQTGDFPAVGFTSDCEVNRFELTGLDAGGEADLAKRGIRVRGKTTLSGGTPAL